MKNRIPILNELKEISPVLATIPFGHLYVVPQVYFDSLPAMLLSQAKDEENRVAIELPTHALPAGYFDQLADSILVKIKAADSKEDDLSSTLQSLKDIAVYQTPIGYFDKLSDNILANIEVPSAADELRSLSPMLYSIQNERVYEVPNGYFDSLATDLQHQIQPAPAAKLISIQSSKVWMRYAVAALFTGFMALGVFKFIPLTSVANTSLTAAQLQGLQMAKENRLEEELAKVSDEEIIGFLTKDGVDVEAALTFAAVQDNDRINVSMSSDAESNEIDELLNQLDETKSMN